MMISEEVLRKSAIEYLNGLRVPATLLAGSSLAALFVSINTTGDNYKNNDIRSILQQQSLHEQSNTDKVIREIIKTNAINSIIQPRIPNKYSRIIELVSFRIYYGSCFISLLMSLITIIYTTVGGTRLLLTAKNDDNNNLALPQDAYHYMKYTIELNFVLSRWSSIMSIVFFFILITFRTILEFNLLYPPRIKVGLGILFLMIFILLNLSSHVNETLNCFPNFFVMTQHVIKVKKKPIG